MINILVTDPNPAFGGMTQQVLEETGRYNVTLVNTGAETITAAGKASFDLILVEATLTDLSLRDLVTAIRLNSPHLPIMVALPLGEQALPDAAQYFDVQGILTKPFYIPDLERDIQEALTKPVGGVVPPARAESLPATPAAHAPKAAAPAATAQTQTRAPANSKRTAPPAPAWLNDVNRAAQYLTTLTLESSAEAALLMRGQHLIAFAGQCSKEEADELAQTVAANWAKETDAGGGAQVRFLRLTSGADYLVYSSLAAQDVVLSMAFQAETPLGQIRKQAKRLTEALVKPSDSEPTEPEPPMVVAPSPSPAPAEIAPAPVAPLPIAEVQPLPTAPVETETRATVPDLVQSSKVKTKPLPPLPDAPTEPSRAAPSTPAAAPSRGPEINWTPEPNWTPDPGRSAETKQAATAASTLVDDVDLGVDWAAALSGSLPEAFRPDWTPAAAPASAPAEEPTPTPAEDVEPIPDQESLNALSNQLLQLERQALVEQPLLFDLSPAPIPNIRRTPHGLYDLSYTFLFLPRLPHVTLTGDLKARLEQWLIALADTHDWDATTIQIEEDHVEISLNCAPADSPERIIKTILAETSDKVLAEYPRLAAAHAKRPGAFWSTGYYVVTPGRHLAPAEVSAFVEYQRHEQSGGKL